MQETAKLLPSLASDVQCSTMDTEFHLRKRGCGAASREIDNFTEKGGV